MGQVTMVYPRLPYGLLCAGVLTFWRLYLTLNVWNKILHKSRSLAAG